MSSTLPREPLAKIEFFEDHNGTWTTNATAIGTSATEMTALTAKTADAREAYEAARLAREQAKTATFTYHNAVRAMTDAGTDVIKKIKAKAAVDGDTVYELAMIPPPAAPSPIPPPGQPKDLTATLGATGVLELAWKCANPKGSGGTIYQVARQTGTAGEFQIIGCTGQRKFSDPSIPAGTAQVTYQIQAIRSTVAGPPNEFTVKFGAAAGGSGLMTARVVADAPKLAA